LVQAECLPGITDLSSPGGYVTPDGEGVGVVGALHPLLIGQQLPVQPERLAGITSLSGPVANVGPDGEGVGINGTDFGGESFFLASPSLEFLGGDHRSSCVQAREDTRVVAERPKVCRFRLSRVLVERIGGVMPCHWR